MLRQTHSFFYLFFIFFYVNNNSLGFLMVLSVKSMTFRIRQQLSITFPYMDASREIAKYLQYCCGYGQHYRLHRGCLIERRWYHKPEKANGSEKTFIVDPGKEYEIRVSKNGMSYSQSGVTAGETVTVPVSTITVDTGEINDCSIGVLQNGTWVYQARTITGSTTSFDVFDNGKPYEVRISKGGMSIIKKATDSVTVETYAINIPEGLKNVGLVQNGSWVYTNITSPSTIYVFKNDMSAEFRYTSDGISKK